MYDLDILIPQKPPMRMIDKCLDFNNNIIHCQAKITSNHLFFCDKRKSIPHWIAVEIMAQTSATFAKLDALGKTSIAKEPQVAFLMSIRQYKTEVLEYFENELLDIYSESVLIEDGVGVFKSKIEVNGKATASITISAYQPQNNIEVAKILTRD
ncbi:beta-alanine--pyruvate aminotransferase [Pseudofrancisella aestuarii]|uniref:Beta-alanine--pyruvate aminotransferase n=1 Tax=Pseudofrancisella aestuarii TaxID=2670347 RepID=A0ABV9T975_9GAMM|nr:beta-alanine--pyruvate aminotransferase [Pseudofrancisella aestuarii]